MSESWPHVITLGSASAKGWGKATFKSTMEQKEIKKNRAVGEGRTSRTSRYEIFAVVEKGSVLPISWAYFPC